MSKYKVILFDMDGTLVPMDLNEFTANYMSLIRKCLSYAMDPDLLEKSIWYGTGKMIKNDGSIGNLEAFWGGFKEISGQGADTMDDKCLEFYNNEFNKLKDTVGKNELASETVKLAKEKAKYVVLATNPYFPLIAQKNRISWVGVNPDDFDYITGYEDQRFCKSNVGYYLDLIEKYNVLPSECLMIGNDEKEDAYMATMAGMDAYIIDDCVIHCEKHPWDGPHGTYIEMLNMLRSL